VRRHPGEKQHEVLNIPEKAINGMTLMPSNPAFGLNALGGSISIEMKNGWSYQGVETKARAGSFGRRAASFEAGGQQGNLSGYVAVDAIHDSGWRPVRATPRLRGRRGHAMQPCRRCSKC
jgi:hypothetical protein